MFSYDLYARKLMSPILHYRVKFSGQGEVTYSETAIVESGLGENVRVFPNPANGSINVKTDSDPALISVSLMDPAGRRVRQATPQIENVFDVSGLPPGLYCIILEYGNGETKAVKVQISH